MQTEKKMTGSHPGLRRGHRCRPEQRVYERVALKILQILDRLPDSDESHGQLEFLGNRNDNPSASGTVELRQDQTGDTDRLMKLTSLGQRVLPDRGVQHEEDFVRRTRTYLRDDSRDLSEFVNEMRFRVQSAGRIN